MNLSKMLAEIRKLLVSDILLISEDSLNTQLASN